MSNNLKVSSIGEWLKKNISLYNSREEAILNCVEQLQVKRRSVVKQLLVLKKKGEIPLDEISNISNMKVGNDIGISEEELRAKHDIVYKLEQAVKLLTPGRFVTDYDFRALVSIDCVRYRIKSNLPQFNQYKGKVNGVIYWGNPKDIKRLKEEGILL